ncbi:merozoite TRAP-like protein, putative [Plasmodium chabaudi chabaudi]|uniref:Merozoite TRAP-like protein, putative n=1 Tax=Plasmodium chabaudi chabaudi TaxID=31271 RepID=A0A1C6X896_PLACU|nr:merozoite TRAP-like protein, putative [Plasmodium chabaudi chabaudi]
MKTQITSYLYAYVLFAIIQIKYNSANETCDNWGPWSPCNNQLTTRTCLNNPSLKEEEDCTQCKEWTEWLECKNGKRSRHIINCPFIIEIQDCMTDINGEVINKNKQVIFENPDSENQECQSSNTESTIKPHFLQTQDNPQPAQVQGSEKKENPPATGSDTQTTKEKESGTPAGTDNLKSANKADTEAVKTAATSQDKSITVTTDGQTTEGEQASGKSGEGVQKSTTKEETLGGSTDQVTTVPTVGGEGPNAPAATVPGANTLETIPSPVSTPAGSTLSETGGEGPSAESGVTDESLKQILHEGDSRTDTLLKRPTEIPGSIDTLNNLASYGQLGNPGYGIQQIPGAPEPNLGNVMGPGTRPTPPGGPGVPGGQGVLGGQGVPGAPSVPGVPGVSGVSGVSGVPGASVVPGVPGGPGIAGTNLSLNLPPGSPLDPALGRSPGSSFDPLSNPFSGPAPGPSPIRKEIGMEETPGFSATQNESVDDIMRTNIDPISSEINTDGISSPTPPMEDTDLNVYNNDLSSMDMHNYNGPGANNNLHSHMNPPHGESMGRSHKFGALRNGPPSNFPGQEGPYRNGHPMNNSNTLYESSHKPNLRNNGTDEIPFEHNNEHDRYGSHNPNDTHETSEQDTLHELREPHELHEPHESYELHESPESHEEHEGEERDQDNRHRRSRYNNSEEHAHFSKLYVASGMGVVILLSGAIASYALYNDKNKQNTDSIFNNGFADIPANKMIHEDEFWGTE